MEVTFQFDWAAAFGSIPHLLPGIPWTLLISFGGLAIGFVIGIVFGLMRISRSRWLRRILIDLVKTHLARHSGSALYQQIIRRHGPELDRVLKGEAQ